MSSTSRPTPRCAASWSAAWLKALATPRRRHSGRTKQRLSITERASCATKATPSHRVIGLVRDEVGVEHRRRIRRLAPHQKPHVLRASRRIGTNLNGSLTVVVEQEVSGVAPVLPALG